jgi:hypothetical protein
MGISLVSLVPGVQLSTGNDTLYTAPPRINAKVNNATLTNTTANSAVATVWLVPQGGTRGNATCVMFQKAVQAGETYTCPELVGKNIETGGTLVTNSNANSAISMNVAGLEVW